MGFASISAFSVIASALAFGLVATRADSVQPGSAPAPSHWAYQPVRSPSVPSVHAAVWPRNGVDAFVLYDLEKQGLVPAPDADRPTLCRRLFLDLTGLPPTPEDMDAFAADTRPDAMERLVDGLLASPRFGEHWARHWFDIVRYAESVTLRGFIFKEAWRYRDYVIDAFNQDRPVDVFLREQIAGDLLPADTLEERQRQTIATTFLMLGNTNLEEQDKRQLEMDVVDEQLDVIGKAFLGQTLNCARCHDHKFDPIPTRDYYALAGILKNAVTLKHDNVSAWTEVPLPLEAGAEAVHRRHEMEVAAVQEQVRRLRSSPMTGGGGGTNELRQLEARLKELRAKGPVRPMVMAPREGTNATDLAVNRRGSVHALGEMMPRGFLKVASVKAVPDPGPGSGGRRELADWITHPANPLTGRVLVNRVWLWLMGQGLVRTPDNFGTTGEAPTNPELLDWLAGRFTGIAPVGALPNGLAQADALKPWSLKSLVRTVVLSRAYRMTSEPSELALRADPENRHFTRAERRRLSAEQLRDSLLAVSGQLRLDSPRGPTFPLERAADYDFVCDDTWRSVYTPAFRNAPLELIATFDGASSSAVTGQRNSSTVAPQALYLLNNPFVRSQAVASARRLLGESLTSPDARLDRAFRLVLGRAPTVAEQKLMRARLAEAGPGDPGELAAWADVFHALFGSIDFAYVH